MRAKTQALMHGFFFFHKMWENFTKIIMTQFLGLIGNKKTFEIVTKKADRKEEAT